MKLIVNGEAQNLSAETLSDVLAALDFTGDWLATAVNGDLVHRGDREVYTLADDDRIEILAPMQGG